MNRFHDDSLINEAAEHVSELLFLSEKVIVKFWTNRFGHLPTISEVEHLLLSTASLLDQKISDPTIMEQVNLAASIKEAEKNFIKSSKRASQTKKTKKST